MSLPEILIIWPGSPVLSLIIEFVIAILLLYLARGPAHKAIYSLSAIIHSGLRLMARSVLLGEKRLVERNREVILATGARAAERLIEREFYRVDAVVKRDMSGYPALQHKLGDQIAHIDEDYRESTEVPVPSPDWVKAVDTLAKLPSKGDSWIANILGEIHKTAQAQYKNTMEEYRKAVSVRHSLLEKMMPYWRRLSQTLDQVDKTIIGLHERSKVIDNRMAEYEEIRNQSDKAVRMLTSSAMTQFFIAALVLLIAIGGAVINFNLIALPMSEMVGGGSYIGNFKTSNIAALVIILVEVAMGLYLMESLRITHLFPVIGHMDDKMRTRMIWVTFSILLILAGVESALAFMRDRIAADMQALRHALATVETAQPVSSWIPTVGQMVMGFILPFALTFVAIPLESFVQSSRTVFGSAVAGLLRLIGFGLRLLGNMVRYIGEFLVNIYDLLIFPPLWLENLIRNKEQHTEVSDIIVKEEV
ncbi:MAG: hypothetical protein IMF20_00790 [Proteobacteria bacterium]|nr:hypothetical protein [Pseudomonadota bacterium]